MNKKCKFCNKEFNCGSYKHSKFCNKKCKWTYYNKSKRNKLKNIRICISCNKEFKWNNNFRKYCSKSCYIDKMYGKLNNIKCQYCNKLFQSRRSYARFCSRRCLWNGSSTKRKLKDKKKLLEIYGDKCACCNENRKDFLTLDHIGGGGNEHRKIRSQSRIYSDVIKEKNHFKYRILCMNCNFAIGIYGKCPHEKEGVKSGNTSINSLS